MDFKKPHVVDLSNTIKIADVRLSDILAQHAERLGELEAEDPAPPPRPAYSYMPDRAPSPLPPPEPTPEMLKQSWPSSPELLAAAPSDADEGGSVDASSNAPLHRDRKRKRPQKHKGNRNAKRTKIQALEGHSLKACALNRVLDTVPVPVEMSLETHHFPVASTGWVGRQDSAIENAAAHAAKSAAQEGDCAFQKFDIPPRRVLDREEALAEPGMRLITAKIQGPTTAVVDADDRVIIVLNCGPSGADDWERVTNQASTAMDSAAKMLYGPDYDKEPLEQPGDGPRRGSHYAVHMGNGMGGGQQKPTPFALHDSVLQILVALFLHHAIARFIGLANLLFQMYAPKLHKYYFHTMRKLHKWGPNLPLLAPLLSCVFSCVTFNFGPRTVTFPHLDFLNLAWGWCFITALGWYDYRKGGHLIIWDLRLVIEFPPGSTFAIPSAILRHSNVSIQQGEKRFSITQYTSAGIFRFVKNGFRTDATVKSRMSKAKEREFAAATQTRYSEGLKMYSTLDELKRRAFM